MDMFQASNWCFNSLTCNTRDKQLTHSMDMKHQLLAWNQFFGINVLALLCCMSMFFWGIKCFCMGCFVCSWQLLTKSTECHSSCSYKWHKVPENFFTNAGYWGQEKHWWVLALVQKVAVAGPTYWKSLVDITQQCPLQKQWNTNNDHCMTIGSTSMTVGSTSMTVHKVCTTVC